MYLKYITIINLQKQSWTCPIIDNCVPANSDELIAELCKMYYNGEITDDQDQYKDAQHINFIKSMLAQRGHDDEFVERIRETYKDKMNLFDYNNKKEDMISDEEEQKILNEFSNSKIKV